MAVPVRGLPCSEDVESWKEHLILPLEASNLGNVRHVDTKKGVRIYVNNCGYLYTHTSHRRMAIHRIVADTWMPRREYSYFNEVDHINRDNTDNRVSNLRWVSHRLNSLNKPSKGYYRTRHGTYQTERIVFGKRFNLGCFKTEAEAKARVEDITPRLWNLAVMFENVIDGIRESIREDRKQQVIC